MAFGLYISCKKSLTSLICWVSGAKRSLIFAVIDKLSLSRLTFETAEKIGKSLLKSITIFGFVIVFVFLLAMTRSFFIMSSKSFCIMLSQWAESRTKKYTTHEIGEWSGNVVQQFATV